MPVVSNTWAGSSGSYPPAGITPINKKGGVASCMTWAPENRKELTVTRPNQHYYERVRASTPNHVNPNLHNNQSQATKYLDDVTNNRARVHEDIAARIVNDDVIPGNRFERDVIGAVHGSAAHQAPPSTYHAPHPPPPGEYRRDNCRECRPSDSHGRQVLIAEPGCSTNLGRSQLNDCSDGRCYSPLPRPITALHHDVTRPMTGVHHDVTRPMTGVHHDVTRPMTGVHHDVIHRDEPPISSYTAHYQGRPSDDLRLSRRDVTNHQKQLEDIRHAAAEERKNLTSIYQSVKADEKFQSRATPERLKLAESQLIIQRQREELEMYSKQRLQDLADKRAELVDKYERNKRFLMSGDTEMKNTSRQVNNRPPSGYYSKDRNLEHHSGRPTGSHTEPWYDRDLSVRGVSDWSPRYEPRHNQSMSRSIDARCNSPYCDRNAPGNSTRPSSRCCNSYSDVNPGPLARSNSVCYNPRCDPNTSSSSYYTRTQGERCYSPDCNARPPIAPLARSRTGYTNWNPSYERKPLGLTRSQSFRGYDSPSDCVDCRRDQSRCVTLYNPGRLTPVAAYHGERRGHVTSGREAVLETEDTKVKVKLDCQPNTDTLVSFRVQSRQV